jgi:hypothetical protein
VHREGKGVVSDVAGQRDGEEVAAAHSHVAAARPSLICPLDGLAACNGRSATSAELVGAARHVGGVLCGGATQSVDDRATLVGVAKGDVRETVIAQQADLEQEVCGGAASAATVSIEGAADEANIAAATAAGAAGGGAAHRRGLDGGAVTARD